jgi:hypothetical protein
MRSSAIIWIAAIAGLFSCEHQRKSASANIDAKILDSTKNIRRQNSQQKYIYTSYEYADSSGARLIIQNSVPKSGINYTAPSGKHYVYAVFWTRISNETANALELNISFPADSFELPISSGNYMRLHISSDTMTVAKEPLADYGLGVKSFLDSDIHKASLLKRIIYPHESSSFYVVPLSNHGVGGILRTSLSLKEQSLIYKVNDKEIYCGNIDLKNLLLQK